MQQADAVLCVLASLPVSLAHGECSAYALQENYELSGWRDRFDAKGEVASRARGCLRIVPHDEELEVSISGSRDREKEDEMSAYVIANVDVKDPLVYEEYRKLVPVSLEKYRGKVVVRGGRIEKLEGNWEPKRLIVIEFEGLEQAKRWYSSEEYGRAKEVRLRATTTDMILVEGV